MWTAGTAPASTVTRAPSMATDAPSVPTSVPEPVVLGTGSGIWNGDTAGWCGTDVLSTVHAANDAITTATVAARRNPPLIVRPLISP